MTQTPYQRVDTQALEKAQEQRQDALLQTDSENYGIRLTVLPMVVLLAIVQVAITIYGTHTVNTIITPTLIAIMAFAVLFIGALFANPMLQMPFLSATGVMSGFVVAAAGFWYAS